MNHSSESPHSGVCAPDGADGHQADASKTHSGHSHLHHHHHTQTKAVLNRIARVTGHLQSVGRMVEDGRDCFEVLIQLAAVRSAVTEISRIVLTDHMEHCIADAIHHNEDETIQELNKAIAMLLK